LEIQDGRQVLIFKIKSTRFPVDHHGGRKVGPIVFILSKNIVMYKEMPCGNRSIEIGSRNAIC
jgi:hypothetical protein